MTRRERRLKGFAWPLLLATSGAIGCGELAPEPAPTATADTTATTETAALAAAPSRTLDPSTRFFVPAPNPGAVKQAAALLKGRKLLDAARIAAMEATPSAVWFTGGTPDEATAAVRKTMQQAARERRVPVLVAYNLPFRDCAQYSAGGALDLAAYEAWIDGFAAGIGSGQAVVILEPDGLGLIRYNTTIYGAKEDCKPKVLDETGAEIDAPGATSDNRYAEINYAVDSIERQAAGAALYLDATHSAWLGVGEAASRLYRAGVQRAQGFFTNASNYRLTAESIQFGTWVSDCITAATAGAPWAAGHFDWCPSQYDPATNYSTVNYTPEFAAGVTAGLQGLMGGATATTRFVIDTSRNGRGPLDTSPYAAAPFNQPASVIGALNAGNWCNPPGAGLGPRPTANTGVALVDAYLWVKIPGESDGSCDIDGHARGWDYTQYDPWAVTGDAQNHFDPLWGMVDPAAGAWFDQQALQLAQNATPPLF